MKQISPPHHDFNPVSFYLFLEDAVDEPVMGQVTFSLLDQDGKPVLSRTHTTRMFSFSLNSSFGFHKFIRREDMEQSKHLKDDCFAVSVHLVITKGAPSVKVPPSNLHSHYGDLLSSKQGADVEFMMFEALLIFIYTDMLPKMDQEDEVAMAQHLLVASDTYGLQRLMLICEDRLCNHINTDSVAIMLVLAEKHHCIRLKEVCFEFLSSSTALVEFMESSDFLYFIRSCPTVLKDLIYNVAAHGK
ncbi:hypothetical protein OsI_33764 [Oryza sativa Indica Group]|uniref:MATH domain-containing protein n=1 Tax=Oryza sativa subsp. indica TaxID=39946 RepID=A2Z7S9_ORYSI|nr:hypothetical protein OsI_33764 [Oryza sativa Indica Group]